jgi:hypothetical protein
MCKYLVYVFIHLSCSQYTGRFKMFFGVMKIHYKKTIPLTIMKQVLYERVIQTVFFHGYWAVS